MCQEISDLREGQLLALCWQPGVGAVIYLFFGAASVEAAGSAPRPDVESPGGAGLEGVTPPPRRERAPWSGEEGPTELRGRPSPPPRLPHGPAEAAGPGRDSGAQPCGAVSFPPRHGLFPPRLDSPNLGRFEQPFPRARGSPLGITAGNGGPDGSPWAQENPFCLVHPVGGERSPGRGAAAARWSREEGKAEARLLTGDLETGPAGHQDGSQEQGAAAPSAAAPWGSPSAPPAAGATEVRGDEAALDRFYSAGETACGLTAVRGARAGCRPVARRTGDLSSRGHGGDTGTEGPGPASSRGAAGEVSAGEPSPRGEIRPEAMKAGPPRPRRPGRPRRVTRGARPVGRGAGPGAVREEVNLLRNAGQVEIGPEKSPRMGMGSAGGYQQDESGRRNREERAGWEGGTRGSPHATLRGEQRHRTTGAPSCCGRASLRIRGAGGPGDGGGQAGGHRNGSAATPPVPPGRSAGGGGRSLGRMAGRFLKIWGALFSHRGPQLISADLQTGLSEGTPTAPAALPPGPGAAGPALIPQQTAPECPPSSLSASPRPGKQPLRPGTAARAPGRVPNAPRRRGLGVCASAVGAELRAGPPPPLPIGAAAGRVGGDGWERLTRAGGRRSGLRRRPQLSAGPRFRRPPRRRCAVVRGCARLCAERRAGRAPPRSALQDLSEGGRRRGSPGLSPPPPSPARRPHGDRRGPLLPPPAPVAPLPAPPRWLRAGPAPAAQPGLTRPSPSAERGARSWAGPAGAQPGPAGV
ncbi:collagen alpha-1(I) chain-like [Cinclus cinclus]|uniref:collagen alpha-1(I) chain-like n=1 Tax=Cinclus cinclus TaxID=127875 RepID=UPI002E11F997